MGKKKTKKKPTLKSASKKKTKKTIQRGGFPFGFNPILKDNVEIVIKDGLDKAAYAQRNKVLPTGHGDWFSFDFNNIYDNTYNFFNQTPIENPVKTVKIALNTETDVKKINLLNKIIRKYNSERNIRLRREKMMQKGGAVVAGEIGLSKDILSSVLKTLDPRETKDAQELIDHGVFDKLISKQSEPVVKRQLSEVDKKHEELVEQNRKLMEEIRNQKRAKEKEDNEEFKKTQNLFAKPENFDKMSEKEKIEYAVNLADKLLNTKTIKLLDRMQKRKIEQDAEAQKRASSQAAEKLYEVEQERKAALIQKRNLEIENSLISQRLSKLELGKKIIQEQLDKIVVEKNKAEAELLEKTADLTKENAVLQKEIEKVTKESNQKTDEIQRLESELAKLQKEKDDADNAIEKLDNDLKAANTTIAGLRKDVLKRIEQIDRLDAEIKKRYKEYRKVGKRLKEVRANLQTIKGKEADAQKEILRLNQRITTAETDVQTLTGQVTKLSTDLKDATNKIDQLTKDKTTLETEVTTLKQTIDDRTAEKEAAEQKINALKGNNSNSSARIRELLTTKKDLEKENADLRTKLQTKQQELDTANDEITNMQKEIDKKTDDIKKKEDEITRINGEIATANGNNTTLTNDNTELTNKIKDLEKEIQMLKTQGPPAAATPATLPQVVSANTSASTSASSGSILQMASSELASRPAVPAPGKTMGQTLSEYYRNRAENDPNYRKFLLKRLVEQNFDFPENLTIVEIEKLMTELLQNTTMNETEQNVQLESLSKKLTEHPEKKLQIKLENESFLRDVVEQWAEYSLKYMKMFIPINLRDLKKSEIETLGGYSPGLSKYLFEKNCLQFLANEFANELEIKNNRPPPNFSFLKNPLYNINNGCNILNLDFIEAVALYKMLPDDDKFTSENVGMNQPEKLQWKQDLLERIKNLHKENKTSHKSEYNNDVPTVDLVTGLLDISFKTDNAKKDARMNELKDLRDKLPVPVSTQKQNKTVQVAPVAPAIQKPKVPFVVKQKKEPLKEGNKVLYQNVEYVLKKINGDGMGATYELADISNGQVTHTLTFFQADKLKKVEEPTSASASSSSASSSSASSTTAPKATVNTQPQFDPKVGDTVKYINKEYIVKSMESKTGAFGTVTNYKICPKDIGCGVNDENVESVPKIQLKPPDPPPTAP